MAAASIMHGFDTALRARTALQDKKGLDILLLDVRGLSAVTDYMLLVTGSSAPHLKALFDDVQHVLKTGGVSCYRRAGKPEGGWLVLDYVDVIIHILSPDARAYYAIEELWPDAPRIPPR